MSHGTRLLCALCFAASIWTYTGVFDAIHYINDNLHVQPISQSVWLLICKTSFNYKFDHFHFIAFTRESKVCFGFVGSLHKCSEIFADCLLVASKIGRGWTLLSPWSNLWKFNALSRKGKGDRHLRWLEVEIKIACARTWVVKVSS